MIKFLSELELEENSLCVKDLEQHHSKWGKSSVYSLTIKECHKEACYYIVIQILLEVLHSAIR